MYLGLDIGTSAVKAVLIDDDGTICQTASAPLEVSHSAPLHAEQDPADWWNACVTATRSLVTDGAALSEVESIGLAGQMHGATLLDQAGQVLRPSILWNDSRSHAECAELESTLADYRERCGNRAMPGFTAPKVLWVRKHEPDVFRRIAKVLLPKDYIAWRMTGAFSSDMSDAAGTLWLDPARREWDDELLGASGLNRSHMPTLHEGCEVVGELTSNAASELGLPRVPVVAGAGDNAGGAVGAGIVEPGQGFMSLGTSGVVFVVSAAHAACPEKTVHAFCHCLPGRWHQMTVTLSAASCLAWLSGVLGTPIPELLQRAAAVPDLHTRVIFLPYLAGERSPHNDPHAVGQFHGLDANTGSGELTLAVLEGVAYSFRDGLDALADAGTRPGSVSLLGGGARAPLWRQVLADATGVALEYRSGGDVGPAFGAARLAAVGHAADDLDAALARVCRLPAIESCHEPDTARAVRHAEKLKKYRELYRLTQHLTSHLEGEMAP
ncbi:MAG: xylulokinase [Pseudomonadota bacterium]